MVRSVWESNFCLTGEHTVTWERQTQGKRSTGQCEMSFGGVRQSVYGGGGPASGVLKA